MVVSWFSPKRFAGGQSRPSHGKNISHRRSNFPFPDADRFFRGQQWLQEPEANEIESIGVSQVNDFSAQMTRILADGDWLG